MGGRVEMKIVTWKCLEKNSRKETQEAVNNGFLFCLHVNWFKIGFLYHFMTLKIKKGEQFLMCRLCFVTFFSRGLWRGGKWLHRETPDTLATQRWSKATWTVTNQVRLSIPFFFFLVVLGLHCCPQPSLVAMIESYSLLQCAGFSLRSFSCCWAQPLGRAGFSSCGVAEHSL